jgi:hypothetical protein
MSTTEVELSWSKATGAVGYEIQRWEGNSWVKIDADGDGSPDTGDGLVPGSDTKFTHTVGTEPNVSGMRLTAYYVMRTVGQGGVTSMWSGVVTGTTQPFLTAGTDAPALILVPIGQTVVRLSWATTDGATGYEVEYIEKAATAADFENTRISRQSLPESGLTASTSHYNHSRLKVGTRYSYRMRAKLGDDVMTDWTDTPVQIVTRPAAPSMSATADTSSTTTDGTTTTTVTVNLTFQPAMLEGDRLAGTAAGSDYEIERRESGSSDWMPVTIPEDLSPSCTAENTAACTVTETGDNTTDGQLMAGKTYFYRIRVEKGNVSGVGSGILSGGSEANALTSYWRQIRVRTPAN